MDSINSRIEQIIQAKANGRVIDFARMIKKSQSQVSNWKREGVGIGPRVTDIILNRFPDINANWLLKGEGDMLNPVKEYKEREVPEFLTLKPNTKEDLIELLVQVNTMLTRRVNDLEQKVREHETTLVSLVCDMSQLKSSLS